MTKTATHAPRRHREHEDSDGGTRPCSLLQQPCLATTNRTCRLPLMRAMVVTNHECTRINDLSAPSILVPSYGGNDFGEPWTTRDRTEPNQHENDDHNHSHEHSDDDEKCGCLCTLVLCDKPRRQTTAHSGSIMTPAAHQTMCLPST
jgi:hypothetical protein